MPDLFVSGFALVGPFGAAGLYEMSHRREAGMAAGWADALALVRGDRAFGPGADGDIPALAAGRLGGIRGQARLRATGLGRCVFTTDAGWTMIVVGVSVGFLFALLALMISVVSFPLLLDREVGVDTAVLTSLRAVVANPAPMVAWGLIVAGSLVLGSIPFFLGLIVVMPVLGHAT